MYEIEAKCTEFIYNSITENNEATRKAFIVVCGELLETIENVKNTFSQVSVMLDAVGSDRLSEISSILSKVAIEGSDSVLDVVEK